MVKALVLHLWSLKEQFIRYFIVGFSAFLLDLLTLIVFKEVFHLAPVLAVVFNQIFLFAYVFFLNKFWSFKDRTSSHRQMVKFLILGGVNYLLAVFIMYIFNHRFNFDYRLVRTGNIALSVSWNFFVYKYWVYKS